MIFEFGWLLPLQRGGKNNIALGDTGVLEEVHRYPANGRPSFCLICAFIVGGWARLAFVFIVCALTLKGVDQKPLAVPKVKPGEYTCVPRGFLLRPFCPGIVKTSRAMAFNYRACVKKKGRMGATSVAKRLTRNVIRCNVVDVVHGTGGGVSIF